PMKRQARSASSACRNRTTSAATSWSRAAACGCEASASRRCSSRSGPSSWQVLLRGEPFDDPPVTPPLVADPVVQAVLPALPELEVVRLHEIAAPERRERDLVAETAGRLLEHPIEDLPAGHDLALGRSPGSQTMPAWSRAEVGFRFLLRQLRGAARG